MAAALPLENPVIAIATRPTPIAVLNIREKLRHAVGI